MIEVFDDKLSLLHLALGVLAYFLKFIAGVFFIYQVVSFCYKYKQYRKFMNERLAKGETVAEFIGDIFEFMIGIGVTHLVMG